MAATDTFEWFVSTMLVRPDEKILAQIKAKRAYLYTLRSEDERSRYVVTALEELRALFRH
jgi:hypothetical protein